MTRSEIRTLPLRTRRSAVTRLSKAVAEALTRRRDRRILAQLDAHMLRDIGLSQDDARTEAAKPFWKG